MQPNCYIFLLIKSQKSVSDIYKHLNDPQEDRKIPDPSVREQTKPKIPISQPKR